MIRDEMDFTMEPADNGAWVRADEAEAEIARLREVLRATVHVFPFCMPQDEEDYEFLRSCRTLVDAALADTEEERDV